MVHKRAHRWRVFFLLENGPLRHKILKIFRCVAYLWNNLYFLRRARAKNVDLFSKNMRKSHFLAGGPPKMPIFYAKLGANPVEIEGPFTRPQGVSSAPPVEGHGRRAGRARWGPWALSPRRVRCAPACRSSPVPRSCRCADHRSLLYGSPRALWDWTVVCLYAHRGIRRSPPPPKH